ncbi:hypothetical protein LCGC14_1215630 [marine sediment metagenome]|uniref:Uncharacterized protein n=2 Tax=root TaxID=1 RepID=A0A831VMP6_9FLAO|nr:hypothetical protein [Pricia antarctica]
MITKQERKKIKKILGNEYSPSVAIELNKAGSVNRFGDAYSDGYIRNVFNGYEHPTIERAIYAAVETKLKENLEEKKRREAILEQTKTGAATPA